MNYIFEKDGNKYHSLGLTHNKKTFKRKNMPLLVNPNKKDNKKAYIRNGYVTKNIKSYSKHKDKKYKFYKSDFANVKSKIRKYKSVRKK